MRIDHLVNGKPLASRAYFETVNPATQQVLAEVARGGAAEVASAVAAARTAFPAWAGRPAGERAARMRKLGDLIARETSALARTETEDTGQPIAQTARQLIPRAAD
ncbi:MAG TPA: aldehyde dehydrogenase family protein, partial [Steroidobacteraceae bacterium]|nr:aldehyde dehydrogenase family protein [Steroidobacteraceae bacterium]